MAGFEANFKRRKNRSLSRDFAAFAQNYRLFKNRECEKFSGKNGHRIARKSSAIIDVSSVNSNPSLYARVHARFRCVLGETVKTRLTDVHKTGCGLCFSAKSLMRAFKAALGAATQSAGTKAEGWCFA